MITSTFTAANANLDTVLHGNCVDVMRGIKAESVDFVLTDPPYINRYTTRDGRTIRSDNFQWVRPAFAELYRVLKRDSFCAFFYAGRTSTNSPRPLPRRVFGPSDI